MERVKKLFKKNELYVFIVIVALGVLIQVRSGQFLTVANLFDLTRAAMVTVSTGAAN